MLNFCGQFPSVSYDMCPAVRVTCGGGDDPASPVAPAIDAASCDVASCSFVLAGERASHRQNAVSRSAGLVKSMQLAISRKEYEDEASGSAGQCILHTRGQGCPSYSINQQIYVFLPHMAKGILIYFLNFCSSRSRVNKSI